MLQRCKDANLVINSEKCHFMVKEEIVLGNKVFGAGLEVDKAKINIISKLPSPTNFKGIRIGAVLGQKDGKHFHPIYFASKTLNAAQQKYTVTEKELMVVILLLQEFDIKIKVKKATKNVVADHLSRIDNDEASDDSDVDDNFPRETLMELRTKDIPWFADFAN
ncbi:DNA-directed DNA polymerase [Tanacetum coccineum]